MNKSTDIGTAVVWFYGTIIVVGIVLGLAQYWNERRK